MTKKKPNLTFATLASVFAFASICAVNAQEVRSVFSAAASDPRPQVESVKMYPEFIHLGEGSTLVIRLSHPAPKGGAIIGVGQISDGTADTLIDTPTSFTLKQGVRKVEFLIRTKRVANASTKIIFCASTTSPVDCGSTNIKSAKLNILR